MCQVHDVHQVRSRSAAAAHAAQTRCRAPSNYAGEKGISWFVENFLFVIIFFVPISNIILYFIFSILLFFYIYIPISILNHILSRRSPRRRRRYLIIFYLAGVGEGEGGRDGGGRGKAHRGVDDGLDHQRGEAGHGGLHKGNQNVERTGGSCKPMSRLNSVKVFCLIMDITN